MLPTAMVDSGLLASAPGAALKVYLALLSHCRWDRGGVCYSVEEDGRTCSEPGLSLQELQRITGLQRRAVMSGLVWLAGKAGNRIPKKKMSRPDRGGPRFVERVRVGRGPGSIGVYKVLPVEIGCAFRGFQKAHEKDVKGASQRTFRGGLKAHAEAEKAHREAEKAHASDREGAPRCAPLNTEASEQKNQTESGWIGRGAAERTEERATPERLIAELELLGIPADERGPLAAGLAMIRNPLRVIHAAAEKGARNGQLLGCLKALVQPIAPTPAAVPQGKNPVAAADWMPASLRRAAANDPSGFESAAETVASAEYRGREQTSGARNFARLRREIGLVEAIARTPVLWKRTVDRLGLKAPEPVVSQEKVGLKVGRGSA